MVLQLVGLSVALLVVQMVVFTIFIAFEIGKNRKMKKQQLSERIQYFKNPRGEICSVQDDLDSAFQG